MLTGDGYSDEWHEEAAKRGLLNLKTTADALPYLQLTEVIDLFNKYEVLSERELQSRLETYLEQYCMTVKVEASLTIEIAKTMIFPATIRYQNELASTCANLKLVGYEFDTDTLDKVTSLVKALQESIALLKSPWMKTELTISSKKPVTAATSCCRQWAPCVTMQTSWKASSPTTFGRCQRTKKCCLSNSEPLRAAVSDDWSRICLALAGRRHFEMWLSHCRRNELTTNQLWRSIAPSKTICRR